MYGTRKFIGAKKIEEEHARNGNDDKDTVKDSQW